MTRMLLLLLMVSSQQLQAQNSQLNDLHAAEKALDDVMEIIDTSYLRIKWQEVEADFAKNPAALQRIRLGILYHELTLNFSFLYKKLPKGYAQRSFDLLDVAYNDKSMLPDFMPFVAAYRASALSLVGAETGKLKPLHAAFEAFATAEAAYGAVCYAPAFLRGSVAENLPSLFYKKRRFAKVDFENIIARQQAQTHYAPAKIMSFTFWAWANQHQGKMHRQQALAYLERAIALDPNYEGGRERAETLRAKLLQK